MRTAAVTVFFSVFLSAYSGTAADRPQPIFSDDFENGIRSEWVRVSKGVQVVPEDPNKPDGNHVLRFSKGGLSIYSPPAAKGDWRTARKREQAFEKWRDYVFAFRFRLLEPVKWQGNKREATLFYVAWRVYPTKESPGDRQVLFFKVFKRKQDQLGLNGPLIAWYGTNERPDTYRVKGAYSPADTKWHAFKARVRLTECLTFLDGTQHSMAKDDRILKGGIGIHMQLPGYADVGGIDIDDVSVMPIQEPGPEKETRAVPSKRPGKCGGAKRAEAVRAKTPPKLDGNLDDPVWKLARTIPACRFSGWLTIGKKNRPAKHQRSILTAYDEENFYIAMEAFVGDVELLDPRKDRPDLGDSFRVDGTTGMTSVDCDGDATNLVYPNRWPAKTSVHIGDETWTVEMAIPWRFLGAEGSPGSTLNMNFSGYDYADGNISWAPTANIRDVETFGSVKCRP